MYSSLIAFPFHVLLFLFCEQTFRVSLQQATTILAGFMTDQLELDLKRNRRVDEGDITQMEADVEADDWEKVRADGSVDDSLFVCFEVVSQ